MFDKDGEEGCGTKYNQNMDVIYTDINGITLLKMHKGYASTNKYRYDCVTVTYFEYIYLAFEILKGGLYRRLISAILKAINLKS